MEEHLNDLTVPTSAKLEISAVVVQLARSSAFQAECCEFESRLPLQVHKPLFTATSATYGLFWKKRKSLLLSDWDDESG